MKSHKVIAMCRHCDQALSDGYSPTGLVHTATGRARCDGLRIPSRPHERNYDMAVAR